MRRPATVCNKDRTSRPRPFWHRSDLLYVDGEDVTGETSSIENTSSAPSSRESTRRFAMGDHVVGDGEKVFEHACKMGLEGIVAKRAGSSYRGGRGKDWLKVKCQKRQETVIVGFTAPKGSRSGLGALLRAVRDGKEYRYVGKVGTGFSEASLGDLTKKLRALVVDEPSAAHAPRMKDADVGSRRSSSPRFDSPSGPKAALLRHPSFEGLREDKKPQDVVRERKRHGKSVTPNASSTARPARRKSTSRAYHEAVVSALLPYAKARPLMLLRWPGGQREQRDVLRTRSTRAGASSAA